MFLKAHSLDLKPKRVNPDPLKIENKKKFYQKACLPTPLELRLKKLPKRMYDPRY